MQQPIAKAPRENGCDEKTSGANSSSIHAAIAAVTAAQAMTFAAASSDATTSWQLIQPDTPAQWQAYYALRYQVLRAPWQQPPGSERDDAEDIASHRMIISADGEALAVGRIQPLDHGRAQIRYMAVHANGQGLGQCIVAALEAQALAWRCQQIVLNARETAEGFYHKLGYIAGDPQAALFGIPHRQMRKQIRIAWSADECQVAVHRLNAIWQQTIPLVAFMQLQIHAFDGTRLWCQAPLAPNKNLHQTMFAGSIASQLTICGWGMVWLQLQALGVDGDIVLARSQVNYKAPVSSDSLIECALLDVQGDLSRLKHGRKARQQVPVRLWQAGQVVAEFVGTFVVLPKNKTNDIT